MPHLYRKFKKKTFRIVQKRDVAYLWDDFVLFISRLRNDQIYRGPPLCFTSLLLTKKVRLPNLLHSSSQAVGFFHCFGVKWRKGNRNSICVATHHFILKAKTQYILAFIFLGTGFWHLSLCTDIPWRKIANKLKYTTRTKNAVFR